MVRAILEGRKTQTRRVVKPKPDAALCGNEFPSQMLGDFWLPEHRGKWLWPTADGEWSGFCPYGQTGDRLVLAMEIQSVGRNYCAGTDGVIYSRARGDWRPLKAHGNGNGYPCVTIMDDGRKTTRAVHSLVCEAFYGPAPFKGAQVRHLDGNPENSFPANVAWGTQSDNWRDRRCHGNGLEGEKHHASKLSDEDRAHVRWAIERGLCSQRHAARSLGMTQSAIGQMIDGCETSVVEQDIPLDRIPFILLEVTGVRVEHLQDITDADAKAEGASPYLLPVHPAREELRHVDGFARLWESINGKGSWEANPWVWVVKFKRVDAA